MDQGQEATKKIIKQLRLKNIPTKLEPAKDLVLLMRKKLQTYQVLVCILMKKQERVDSHSQVKSKEMIALFHQDQEPMNKS